MQQENTEKLGFKQFTQFTVSVCSYTLPVQLAEPAQLQETATKYAFTVNAEISLSTNFPLTH